MRRSGARLTLSGALGKHKDFDTESETDSAIVSQAGREIKVRKYEEEMRPDPFTKRFPALL